MSPDHIWYPYTQMKLAPPPPRIVRGHGAWLEAEDGRRYLDAISSWWVTLHGHAEPRIAAAIARQAASLEQVILANFTHRPALELAERLVALAPPGLGRVFFSDNGSTAVEVALKMALQYWRNCGQPQRSTLVALDHAYHGDTLGAMAVSAPSPFTAPFAAWLPRCVERVPTAYCYRCPVGLRRDSCAIDCAAPLERLLADRGHEIAAVIVEPILQGAGGMIVQPVEFLQRVAAACRRHGTLLIADEVLTGFGRTGPMFASAGAGVQPDLMCLSKGLTGGFLPLGATLAREEIFAAFWSDDRRQTLFHGHSYCGNPIACAAGVANLDLFASEPVAERIAAITSHHARRLDALRGRPGVGDTRQAGTVAVLELSCEESDPGYLAAIGPRLQEFFLARGLVLRPLGPVLYVLPPYCITPRELDRVWDTIEAAIDQIVD